MKKKPTDGVKGMAKAKFILFCLLLSDRQEANIITATKTILKVKARRNGTGANAHGPDHVTGIGDQGPVISARGHVTENVATEDEVARTFM